MWTTIHELADSLWPLLPQLSIGLRFGTAVINAGLAVDNLVRRCRRPPRDPQP